MARHPDGVRNQGGRGGAGLAPASRLGVENGLKTNKGQFRALVDPAIIRNRASQEKELRAKVDADPAMRAQYGDVWDNIRKTLDLYKGKRDKYNFTEGGSPFLTA